jgi:raffinose/stachyose/melibiose transport system permease protein
MNRYLFGKGWARWLPFLLLLPGMLFYIVIALGPSIATSIFSLTDATGVPNIPVNWIGLENYDEFLLRGLASRDNLATLWRTLIFCFFVTTIQFTLGLLVALLLNQGLKGTRFFRTLYFMPVILGVVIQGLIWSLWLYPLGGPVATVFEYFGIQSEFLGGPPPESFTWVMVVQIWANMGITMVIFLAGLQTVPEELYEVAKIDGANDWQIFRNVTWPLITPVVNTNLILNVIGSLQAWQLFLVLIGYKPGTQVLSYLVYAEGFAATSGGSGASFRQGYAAAASMVLFVIVLILGLTTQFLVQRREQRLLG